MDPAWGRTRGVAKLANDDTFHWTNCSPQHFRFNEGKNLWAGLEDFLLRKAGAERKRLTVFTGPVFEPDDPEYRGILIPKRYWKVAVLAREGVPVSLGFLVSQESLLRDFISFGPEDVARTFQTPIRMVEKVSGLRFGRITDVDAMSVTDFAPGEPLERELADFEDIRIPG
jgi:endonuclease G